MKGRSPYRFVVYCEQRYNNAIDVEGNSLILNTDISVKDFVFTNRIGKVVSTPKEFDTPIQPGNEIIVHHNVFRRWYDVKGNDSEAAGFIEDNHFLVSVDEIFGYKQNGEWKAMEGFAFVTPLPPESIWNTTGETALKGVLSYTSPKLDHLRDHVVGFTPESEYEFNIEGERTYRIFEHHITFDYGPKEKTRENSSFSTESS